MKLTEEQLTKLVERLSKYSPNGLRCPVCGGKNWDLSNLFVETREYETNKEFIGEKRVTPFITLICNECSNTLFLNAIRLGIIEKNKEKVDNSNNSNE